MSYAKNPFVGEFNEAAYEKDMTERTKLTTEQRHKMMDEVCDRHQRKIAAGLLVDRRPPPPPESIHAESLESSESLDRRVRERATSVEVRAEVAPDSVAAGRSRNRSEPGTANPTFGMGGELNDNGRAESTGRNPDDAAQGLSVGSPADVVRSAKRSKKKVDAKKGAAVRGSAVKKPSRKRPRAR